MCKPVKLIQIKTGQVLTFESQTEATVFFGYQTKYVIVKPLKNPLES